MAKNSGVTCAILGGREKDLQILSELQRRDNVRISFIYESIPNAIGLEIAEILGITRFSSPPQAFPEDLDFIIVSEPRERFNDILKLLSKSPAKIISSQEALNSICRDEPRESVETEAAHGDIYAIEDALGALEKIFNKKELLKFLLDIAVRAAKASTGSIMLYSPDTCDLYIGYAIGLSEKVIKKTRQKLGEGIAGSVARQKRAKLITLAPDDVLYEGDRERVDIGTSISVPLLWETRLLGVLNVSTARSERELDKSDFENLKRISRRISRVLFESLKVQETRINTHARNLGNTVGKLLEKTASFEEKFSLLADYLGEILGMKTVEIYLNTHEGDWFLLGGSNSRQPQGYEKVHSRNGLLSKCFLDQRPIILTEKTDNADISNEISSLIYHPLTITQPIGVLIAEFDENYKQQEFLMVKDSVCIELASFISSEVRARKMKRELETMSMVSDSVPSLLTCRTSEELAECLAKILADTLECLRVSVKLGRSSDTSESVTSIFEKEDVPGIDWQIEDEKIFSKLASQKEAFSKAVLAFDIKIHQRREPFSSLLGVPIMRNNELFGGIIAYDKRPSDPMQEGVFSDFDRTTINHVLSLAVPVLEAVRSEEPLQLEKAESSYETVLEDNMSRAIRVCQREIQRSDRYHHSFSVLMFKVPSISEMFGDDYSHALELIEEMTRGIRTRTRKTDYLSWIAKDRFVLISLEGTKRIRFLISRIKVYLEKDLSSAGLDEVKGSALSIGLASYPGKSRSAKELFVEAETAFDPDYE